MTPEQQAEHVVDAFLGPAIQVRKPLPRHATREKDCPVTIEIDLPATVVMQPAEWDGRMQWEATKVHLNMTDTEIAAAVRKAWEEVDEAHPDVNRVVERENGL